MTKNLRRFFLSGYVTLFISHLTLSRGQSISTAVPPLQWINLTGLLSGPAPPPLMDASIGYDNASRNFLVFGGESEGGFVQSKTYLLNLDSLTWTTPTSPENLQGSPSARSAALSGDDFAASNRHAHVLIGGKNGSSVLSDVWEFDYNNQFWSPVMISPGGPSPRWGASGGIDVRVAPISDSTVPGPNNTVYLAGGVDEQGPVSLSDVWELHLSGALSSNLPNSSFGSWQHVPIGKLPAFVNQAGTVIGGQIVAAGGCNSSTASDESCAQQGSYVLNTATNSQISPKACPAPRYGGALTQNFNSFSSSFASQVFLLLGLLDSSKWSDGGGLVNGEVAVLDVNAGTWSRVLPSGDPGQSGKATFPSPREGASVLSFQNTMVGSTRTIASDTLVFGGRDASGAYLSELWLLRAYNGVITTSGQKWSGFGNGELQSGVNANGAGVVIRYMTECASAISAGNSPTPSSSQPTSSAAPTSTSSSSQTSGELFDVSVIHKALAPLSVALIFPAVIFLRLASPSNPSHGTDRNRFLTILSALVAIVAYALGVAGLVSSFTSITHSATNTSVQRRSSPNTTLKTGHGKAGLALFAALYGILPVFYLLRETRSFLSQRHRKGGIEQAGGTRSRTTSHGTTEKPFSISADDPDATQHINGHSAPPTERRRVSSFGGHGFWSGSRTQELRDSSDTESSTSVPAPTRGFEVTNRPQRVSRPSTFGAVSQSSRPPTALRDIDWLERRRSLNAVGELDYAIDRGNRAQTPATPPTQDIHSAMGLMISPVEQASPPTLPPLVDIILRAILHALLLALCVLSLVALWSRTSRAGFAVFLTWTLAFYIGLMVCAWHGKPYQSIVTTILYRLRAPHSALIGPAPPPPPPPVQPTPSPRPLSSAGVDQYPFPIDSRGPYIHHQPTYRTVGIDDISITNGGPRSVEEDDDDEDDDTRQQRMEDEMARRDVSIVTVPRRRLWIANPETMNS